MCTNDNNEIMELLKKEDKLWKLLIANPYSNQDDANYHGKLSCAFFNDNFLYRSNKFDEAISDTIAQLIGSSNYRHNVYKIIGYAHCGKTTFIHTIKDEIDRKYSELAEVTIANFENADNTIEKQKKDEYYAIKACLKKEIVKVLSKIDINLLDSIADDFIKEIDNPPIEDDLLFNSPIYDPEGNLYDFFNCKLYKANHPNILYKNLKNLTVAELIDLYILIFAIKSNKTNKIQIIALESLDNLMTKDIDIVVDTLTEHTIHIAKLISRLNIFEEATYNYYNRISIVLVMRNVTDSLIKTEHQCALLENSPIRIDSLNVRTKSYTINDIAPQSEIILYRLNYIKEHDDIFSRKIIDDCNNLLLLLDKDSIIASHSYFFALFNYDYLKTVKVFCDIIDSTSLNNYIDLIKTPKEYLNEFKNNKKVPFKELLSDIKFGARSFISRLIFNSFRDKGYLRLLRVGESKNPTRPILSFCTNQSENLEEAISFISIYQAFSHLYQKDDIINSIIQMFSLRAHNRLWNHFISIEYAGTNDTSLIWKKLEKTF